MAIKFYPNTENTQIGTDNALPEYPGGADIPSAKPPNIRWYGSSEDQSGMSAYSGLSGLVGNTREMETRNIQGQLGSPFNPQGEITDFLLRADLARSNETAEKELKLRAAGYAPQTVDTNQGPRVVARGPTSSAYTPIDTPAGSLTSDVADIGGSLLNEENLLSMMGALFGPQTGIAGLVGRAALSGIGGYLGNKAGNTVEDVRGYQTTSPEAQNAEAATAALGGSVGELFALAPSAARKTVMGERGPFVKPGSRADRVLQTAKEVNEQAGPGEQVDLTLGNLFNVFKRRENQVASTNENIIDYRAKQGQALVDNLKGFVGQGNQDELLADPSLLKINQDIRSSVFNQTGETPGVESLVDEAGQALKRGRESFVGQSRDQISRLYDTAFARATPDTTFNIKEVQDLIDQTRKGVNVPTTNEGEYVPFGADFPKELTDKLDRILKVRPDLRGREGFEQIKEIRSALRDYKEPDPLTGRMSRQASQVNDIYKSLTKAMENPTSADTTFVETFQQANKAANTLQRNLETKTMRDILNSENPRALFEQIAAPGNVNQLEMLFEKLPPKETVKLKQGFDEFLRLQPERINQVLDTFAADKRSLDMLIPPERQNTLRVVGSAFERISKAPSQKVLKTTGDIGARAIEIMEGGSDEQFDLFVQTALRQNPGKDKETKKALLAGSINSIIEKHTTLKDGRVIYKLERIASELDKLIRTGRMQKIADPELLKGLSDRSYLASILGAANAGSDMGASLQGAAIAARAASLNPKEFVQGQLEVGHNRLWGWVATNPKIVSLLAGGGRQGNAYTKATDAALRNMTRVINLASDDIERAGDLNFVRDEEQKTIDKNLPETE